MLVIGLLYFFHGHAPMQFEPVEWFFTFFGSYDVVSPKNGPFRVVTIL